MNKVGFTGVFFKPGPPFHFGEFIKCKIVEINGKSLTVELEDGSRGDIPAYEFQRLYYFNQDGGFENRDK